MRRKALLRSCTNYVTIIYAGMQIKLKSDTEGVVGLGYVTGTQ